MRCRLLLAVHDLEQRHASVERVALEQAFSGAGALRKALTRHFGAPLGCSEAPVRSRRYWRGLCKKSGGLHNLRVAFFGASARGCLPDRHGTPHANRRRNHPLKTASAAGAALPGPLSRPPHRGPRPLAAPSTPDGQQHNGGGIAPAPVRHARPAPAASA
jgi:hypothetical protein